MTQSLPADRTFVDLQRKIVDSWVGIFKRLEPLLPLLTTENVATIKALIEAAQEANDAAEVINENIFALPIDTSPLFSEDYALGFSNNENAGRRYPLSLFAKPSVLISTTSFSGTQVDVSIPTGYTDVELRVSGLAVSSATNPTIAFSEDGNVTFLTIAIDIFRSGTSQSNNSIAGAATWAVSNLNNTDPAYGSMVIEGYQSGGKKAVREQGQQTGVGWVGGRILTSTAAINAVRYAVSVGSFSAGTVELWGIP